MTGETVGFGGGCHWCTEAVFQAADGAESVEQGWIRSEPPHDAWSEAVRLQLSDTSDLHHLVRIHLHTHSSTSMHAMRTKYRSAIYTQSHAMACAAEAALRDCQAEFGKPLVTVVLPLVAFRPSDAAYQNYYKQRPDRPFCQTYIAPKLKRVEALKPD